MEGKTFPHNMLVKHVYINKFMKSYESYILICFRHNVNRLIETRLTAVNRRRPHG